MKSKNWKKKERRDWWGFLVSASQEHYRVGGKICRLAREDENVDEHFTTWTLEDYKCKTRGFVWVKS